MKGRYGHVAGVVLNDTLLISGGYRGSVLGDLLALKLPPSIITTDTTAHPVSCIHCLHSSVFDAPNGFG